MKSEIDQVFTEKGINGYLVLGNGTHNPAMVYLTGGGHISNAVLVKKTGEEALLVVNSMEREEGARTGIRTKTFNDFKLFELIKAAGGDVSEAESQFIVAILQEVGLTKGKIVLYGQIEIAEKWEMLQKLSKRLPDLELIGDSGDSALGKVRLIKDLQELERIRQMGMVTTRTVDRVAKYIQSCQVKGDQICTEDGTPVTIGDIKKKIDLWLAEQGAENPEATIFAMGRDGGIPHSTGTDSDILRTGTPIVFDIYPCEKGGGYFYDFTRTWCIGYAPEQVQKLYENVLEVYNRLVTDLTVGTSCKQYQKWTCDLFEAMGHPTIQTNPKPRMGTSTVSATEWVCRCMRHPGSV